jgi:hypothetical protein
MRVFTASLTERKRFIGYVLSCGYVLNLSIKNSSTKALELMQKHRL